jgi:hypothetical protein
LGVILILLAKTFNPFRLSVEKIPNGFNEKQFNTVDITLNYVEGPNNLLLMPSFIASYRSISLALNKKLRPNKPYDLLNARFDQRAGLKFISEYDVDFSIATIDGRLTGYQGCQGQCHSRCSFSKTGNIYQGCP